MGDESGKTTTSPHVRSREMLSEFDFNAALAVGVNDTGSSTTERSLMEAEWWLTKVTTYLTNQGNFAQS